MGGRGSSSGVSAKGGSKGSKNSVRAKGGARGGAGAENSGTSRPKVIDRVGAMITDRLRNSPTFQESRRVAMRNNSLQSQLPKNSHILNVTNVDGRTRVEYETYISGGRRRVSIKYLP